MTKPIVAEFFKHVTPEDLRFRFLGAVREVSHERLVAMTRSDDPHIHNFLARKQPTPSTRDDWRERHPGLRRRLTSHS